MKRPLILAAAALACCTFSAEQVVRAQTDPESGIAKQCESLCKTPKGPWRTIPWETDLIHAQRLAVKQSRPLFIWAMDGHPLACT